MKLKKNNFFKSIIKSFQYAIKGFAFCLKNERNMKIHLSSAILIIFFGIIYGISKLEFMFIVLAIGVVISSEMINTSIEQFVNLNVTQYNSIAKIVKDVAAGAVFVNSIVALFIGIIIFNDLDKICGTIILILKTPILLIIFLIILFIIYVFIFDKMKDVKNWKKN